MLPHIGQIIPLTARWPIQMPNPVPKIAPDQKPEEPKQEK
jgi:hypothetical protein